MHHFLRLPREIRNEVYGYLFIDPSAAVKKADGVIWQSAHRKVPSTVWHSRVPLYLLLVNRQVCAETRDCNYRGGGRLEIHIDDYLLNELEDPDPGYGPRYMVEELSKQSFRRVVIGLELYDYKKKITSVQHYIHLKSSFLSVRNRLKIFCAELGKCEGTIPRLELRLQDGTGMTYPSFRWIMNTYPAEWSWAETYMSLVKELLAPFELLNGKVNGCYIDFSDKWTVEDYDQVSAGKDELHVAEETASIMCKLLGLNYVSLKEKEGYPMKLVQVKKEAETSNN